VIRKYSYPPFVVFFDTLVIVTFTLLVKQGSGGQVILDTSQPLPPGFQVVSTGANDDSTDDVEMSLPCDGSLYCDVGYKIKLPLDVVSEIGRFKLLAYEAKCGKTDVLLDGTGHIARKKTVDKNMCLQGYKYIQRYLDGRS